MKKCMNCGAELPDEASFCPHCTATQGEKHQVAPRWNNSRRLWLAGGVIVLALVVVLGIWLWQSKDQAAEPVMEDQPVETTAVPEEPQESEAPPEETLQAEMLSAEEDTSVPEEVPLEEIPTEVYYTDEDGEYQVFLCFELGAISEPQPEWHLTVPEGASGEMPIFLVVYKDQLRGREDFIDKIERVTVEAIPEEGCTPLEISEPRLDYSMPSATQMCDITFDSSCGTNRILWTLEMKDGQVLTLCQTLYVTVPKTMDIYPEDEPMDTVEELQALLDRLDLIAGYDTLVNIFLPPTTYEGDLQISSHAVNLVGASDDDGNILTTIQGSIRVSTQRPDLVRFFDLAIVGPGTGTGVSVSAGITLEHCILSGWDIGAVANHGGFVAAHFTTFDNNGVGLKFKTGNYGHCDAGFVSNTFTNNDIALQIEELAGDVELMFDLSVFSGNGVNVDNPTGHPVNLSAAIEE